MVPDTYFFPNNTKMLLILVWFARQIFTAPLLTEMPQSLLLYSDALLTAGMLWNVTDPRLPSESLNIYMQLNGSIYPQSTAYMANPWLSIGFGNSMLRASFITCSQNSTVELASTLTYGPPIQVVSPSLTPISNSFVGGKLECLFNIKTASNDIVRFDIAQNLNLIWAFSAQNSMKASLNQHDPAHCGAFTVNFNSGNSITASVPSFQNKLAHGWGMLVISLCVFPLALLKLTLTYGKKQISSSQNWFLRRKFITLTFEIVGLSVFIGCSWILIPTTPISSFTDSPHVSLGTLIILTYIAKLVFQIAFKFVRNTSVRAFQEINGGYKIQTIRRVLVCILWWAILFLVIFEVPIGINILYPFAYISTGTPAAMWIFYFVGCVFWIIIFALTLLGDKLNAIFNFGSQISNAKNKTSDTIESFLEGPMHKNNPVSFWSIFWMNTVVRKASEVYTWESLAVLLKSDVFYVVHDSKVYDLSKTKLVNVKKIK